MATITKDMSVTAITAMTDAMLNSSTAYETAPAAWDNATTYALGAAVSVAGAAGLQTIYLSLQAGNLNKNPASQPTWWEESCTTYDVYDVGTTYDTGDKCIDTTGHRIYESQTDGNVGESLTDTDHWLDIGPTNCWAMFDDVVGTSTTITSPLTVVLTPGCIDTVALMELTGRSVTVTLSDVYGSPATTAFTETKSLDGTIIEDLYDWFFNPWVQITDAIFTDIPSCFATGELTIELTGTSSVSCGVCKFGLTTSFGFAECGATLGIIDYSTKDVDAFGRYSITQRAYSKRATLSVICEKADFAIIFRALANVRSTPAIWIATTASGFEPLIVYGFFKDFTIDVTYPEYFLCSIDIEGLV